MTRRYTTTMHAIGEEFAPPNGAELVMTHAVERTELVGLYSPMERVESQCVVCVWALPEAAQVQP